MDENPRGLQGSIDSLNQSVNSLISLFKEAAESLKMEEAEANLISKRIDPIFQKLEEISEQNKKIARGIVAIADMIEERMPRRGPSAPSGMQGPPPAMMQRPSMPPSAPGMPPAMGMRPTSLPPRPPVPPAPPR